MNVISVIREWVKHEAVPIVLITAGAYNSPKQQYPELFRNLVHSNPGNIGRPVLRVHFDPSFQRDGTTLWSGDACVVNIAGPPGEELRYSVYQTENMRDIVIPSQLESYYDFREIANIEETIFCLPETPFWLGMHEIVEAIRNKSGLFGFVNAAFQGTVRPGFNLPPSLVWELELPSVQETVRLCSDGQTRCLRASALANRIYQHIGKSHMIDKPLEYRQFGELFFINCTQSLNGQFLARFPEIGAIIHELDNNCCVIIESCTTCDDYMFFGFSSNDFSVFPFTKVNSTYLDQKNRILIK